MMLNARLTKLLIIGSALWGLTVFNDSMAQEAEYNLAHQNIFGKPRRPPVSFSHDIHSEALADAGCGVCHHVQDDQTGQLVYIEGEELSCQECHGLKKVNHTPALREAFHGNCTACHRRMIQTGKPKSGPTTCGGCHRKQ